MTKPIFLLVVLGCIFTGSCSSGDDKKVVEGENAECAPLNPNGDSELAILMREMTSHAEKNAAALREGRELLPYEGQFDSIFNAKRSMKVDDQFFEGMATAYLGNLKKLYSSPQSERITLHNNVINSCQDCHAQTCRGPLKRIDRMLVEN